MAAPPLETTAMNQCKEHTVRRRLDAAWGGDCGATVDGDLQPALATLQLRRLWPPGH